jgi:hypothetical protein
MDYISMLNLSFTFHPAEVLNIRKIDLATDVPLLGVKNPLKSIDPTKPPSCEIFIEAGFKVAGPG